MVDVATSLGGFLPGAEPRHLAPGLALHGQFPASCWFYLCTSLVIPLTISAESQEHSLVVPSDNTIHEQVTDMECTVCGIYRAGKEHKGENGKIDLKKTKEESVVSREGRVWGVKNLYLGGCGVIPTGNASNPTLTAACHAIAGADEINKELRGE